MSYAEQSTNTYFTKTDLEGNYTYVSPYFEKVFKLHPQDVYGTSSLDTIYFEDHVACYETVQKCFRNPKTYQKVILRQPVGTERIVWTKWEFYLEIDEEGNPSEILCYGYNITDFIELKQLVNDYSVKFKEKEKKFQTLFETSSLFIILHTAKGEILEANQTFCDHIGVAKDIITKYNLLNFTHPKNHQEFENFLNKKIVGTTEISLETEIINKNRLITPISINPRAFHNEKGEIFIWTIAKDITERKKQQQQLKDQNKLLEKQNELLEQTAIIAKLGGWELHLNPFRREWTKEVYIIHDLDPDTTINLDNALDYYHPDDKLLLQKAQNSCINNGIPYDLELRLISAKNINKWVRVIGKPVCLNGIIQSVRGTVQDITEKKEVESTIIQQQSLLKDIYFMQSHTIRLPLANILGLVDLLNLTMPELSEENKEIFKKLKFSANQLDEVIKQAAANQPKI
jgi:PAS domain S-box-containing protein